MKVVLEIVLTLKDIFLVWSTSIFQFFISPKRKSVAGEIVLITGGGRGLGRQLALEFAKLKATVVVWDINLNGASETQRLIQAAGCICHIYQCDVGNIEQVKNQGQRVTQDVGHVTMLINNAAIVTGGYLLDQTDGEIQQTINVNILAHFWTVNCFLPHMVERNHGHIVTIASCAGLVGLSQLTVYCACKFGVVGFTEVLNYETVFGGHTGVHTTLVCPSFIGDTTMFGGCQMRFPSTTPPLKLDKVVARIMRAILTNQKQILIPRSMYLVAAMKTIFPVSVMTAIVKFFGTDTFMDTFTGSEDQRLPFMDSIGLDCEEHHEKQS